ncbi:MAG TPA: glycosyltransferase family 4 protein [Candidatus Binataceae bacterium]|nr:glycosyltransferase family 4 protein [Candidatus Binataceae bacterium]
MKAPWLIVSPSFVKAGGMDEANYELARYLADEGHETHLVGHRAGAELTKLAGIHFHRAPRPAESDFLGEPLLAAIGWWWARAIAARGGRVVVNGGNCPWYDANWVHHVHSTFRPRIPSGRLRRLKNRLQYPLDVAAERRIIPRARIAITCSDLSRRDVIEKLGADPDRVLAVYLGIDPERFRPPTAAERVAARRTIAPLSSGPLIAFVGALGDDRKGFDVLFSAWTRLCPRADWDANLVVIGHGVAMRRWQARAAADGLDARIHFLGFEAAPDFVARTLWGCDLLVLPSRYEGYGRPVQEALCCGIPAIVSRRAGVAEQYPPELAELVLADPENAEALANLMLQWRSRTDYWKEQVAPLASALRRHTWTEMARQIVAIIESRRAPSALVSREDFAA